MTNNKQPASEHQTSTKPVVVVKNLNHYYGEGSLKKQILFNINLTVEPGEIVIMKGPSGSGKTTLLTLMGALRSAQTGSLKVFSQELVGATQKKLVEVRRNIGYIFQAHNLLKSLTAVQNVQMSLQLHQGYSSREAKEKSVAMLDAVGLGHRLNYYPDNLSGGQKQSIAIARALVSHPRMVLADEPTAALDSKSGRDVVEIMQKLAKEQQCTIFIVTHDNRILDIADRTIQLEDGRLTKEDPWKEISLLLQRLDPKQVPINLQE
jgi:putative ABC transport system ATP-binding protein